MVKIFMRGLMAIAPITLTIALLIWAFNLFEGLFATPIGKLIGPERYFKGLGLIAGLLSVFIAGLLLNNWLLQRVYQWGEGFITQLPLVKTLYGSIRDLMSFFGSNTTGKGGGVVIVRLGTYRVLGLLTRETFNDLPMLGSDTDVAVFIPLSYQIGGLTVMVPRSAVEKVDLSVEEGLRFAATAGMPGGKSG